MLTPLRQEYGPERSHVISVLLTVGLFLFVILFLILLALLEPKALANPGWSTISPRLDPSLRALPYTPDGKSITGLTQWVKATGRATIVRAPIAQALGISNSDLAVQQRAFRVVGEDLTHVCSAVVDNKITLLASTNEDSGDAVVWRLTPEGNLARTAAFSMGTTRPVENETFYDRFLLEREYFLRKSQEAARTPLRASSGALLSADPDFAASTSARPGSSAEISVLFLYPWVLPVILVALAAGVHQPRRRGREGEL